MADRTKPYKALVRLHLPFIEKDFDAGEMVPTEDLAEAQQTEEDITALVGAGVLGEEDSEIDPSAIIPRPDMPTIEKAVQESQELVKQLEDAGEEVPPELKAMAELDYTHAVASDVGKSGETNA